MRALGEPRAEAFARLRRRIGRGRTAGVEAERPRLALQRG